MAVFTIQINDDNAKKRHLLGLIKEMSKTEKGISIDKLYQPNEHTIEAIEDVEGGKTYKANNLEDLINQLDS